MGPLRPGLSAGRHGHEPAADDSSLCQRTGAGGPLGGGPLGRGQLAGTRSLGHVRHPLRRSSRPATDPHARGVHGLSAPQGLSAARTRRTTQLPRADAGKAEGKIRNTKFEIRNKFKSKKKVQNVWSFRFRFRICFGFRISDFVFCIVPLVPASAPHALTLSDLPMTEPRAGSRTCGR